MNPDQTSEEPASTGLLIGLVGPCGSGKSTLAARLQARGYRVRHIAQEHSYVKDMWQRVVDPEALIFLDASYAVLNARRSLSWTEADYQEQQRRLAHAREHADLYLFTDAMSVDEVEREIVVFLESG